MNKNNKMLSFFVFLVFLTYVFYLFYGFMRTRKEETTEIIASFNIRGKDFYKNNPDNVTENIPDTGANNEAENQGADTGEQNTGEAVQNETANSENTGTVTGENEGAVQAAEESQQSEQQQEANNTKKKYYIRVMTVNTKEQAEEALKKFGKNFKMKKIKMSSGKEAYTIISGTVTEGEELQKLESEVEKMLKNKGYMVLEVK